ncbi:hypothetical protein CHS0354_037640 [Potamilus streckersoni]|uniref:Alpha-tubulin N-acetyltransferase n=1 Tax=Potamilus streckersoni TaxID=2493646 RepID=A0AAE0T7G0_9BIVA|nr:hypothetical protein CHS0354_037640 [Potamilus streckersoni]
MEFNFNINNLFGVDITKVENDITPFRKHSNGLSHFELRSQMFQVIDRMGEASAKAQGLHGSITTGRKLELSDHKLYVMKDTSSSGDRGAAIGILKIGHKKLFVYDTQGNVHELDPLCVLDFYVHESRQRMGCGRRLFDFMLKDTGVQPEHLAIDKPSFKFSQFLKKHYNLKVEIPQVNNFVIYEGFFDGRTDVPTGRRRGYGSGPGFPLRRTETVFDDRLMSNGQAKYGLPPIHNSRQYGSAHQIGHHSSTMGRNNGITDSRSRKDLDVVPAAFRPGPDQRQENVHIELSHGTNSLGTGVNTMYSRHNSSHTPPSSRPESSKTRSTGSLQTEALPPTPPRTPPLLNRDGPTPDYKQVLNMHQDYQGKRGMLRVNGGTNKDNSREKQRVKFQSPGPNDIHTVSTWNSSWTKPLNNYSWGRGPPGLAAKNYHHTRLW